MFFFFKESLASMFNHCEQKWMCISSHWLCRSDCIAAKVLSAKQYHPDCTLIQAIHQFFDLQAVYTIGLITYLDTNLSNQLLKLSYYCTGTTSWSYSRNMNSFIFFFQVTCSLSLLIKCRLAWNLFPQGNVSICSEKRKSGNK